MKKRGTIISLLLLCLLFAIGATSGLITLQDPALRSQNANPQSNSAQGYIDTGKAYLLAHNILAARDQFKQAVAADSINQEANLLYGVTRVFAVVEDGQSLNTGGLDSVKEVLELAGASVQNLN